MTYVPLIGVAGSARQVIITAAAAAAIIAAVPAATVVITHRRGFHYNPSTIKLNFLLSTLENVLTAPLLLSVYSPSPHSASLSAPFFSPAL